MKEKSTYEIRKKMNEFLDSVELIKKELLEMYKSINYVIKKNDSLLVEIKKSVKEQSESLIENRKATESVDETLGNVLLAIRQNEYLQAYYPAQLGFPEMKITGKHPAKNV